jgi:hypothetical protein
MPHQRSHHSGQSATFYAAREALWRNIAVFSTPSHSVWGRVFSDIPDFCRELVSSLAED